MTEAALGAVSTVAITGCAGDRVEVADIGVGENAGAGVCMGVGEDEGKSVGVDGSTINGVVITTIGVGSGCTLCGLLLTHNKPQTTPRLAVANTKTKM